MVYRDSAGVILVFDLACAASFKVIEKWYKSAKEHADENCHFILLGNKADLDQE